ncbi:helix-turn-helix transcriptional regulator [Paenibacillus urinalis]|uniref:Helix-turn-helix transcriptional regulator n=1 Tax=Paenibacillus urinalis TaxID=521520 RepID=A0AAX3MYY9_9BACL|nr:helix-turn-helix transcriptional regulator [Paenibacillus urinalis]WDH82646.1 helix-turn-helix transcriptional regulator [Paenibacillus urinalis]WDI00657.1 helix-turn-helix transcriptional regulator [Paenibacillus urinalis]
MKSNLCHGFMYETEEELRALVGIEEYLDMEFNKGNGEWEPDWDDDSDAYELPSSLAMDVYCKRKAEGLTQKELALKLGIGLETLSKIENGHENLRTKVKKKIKDYLNEED